MIERTDSFITSTHSVPTQNNRLRKLGSADMLSDANGNMLSNGTWSYAYSAHNRLTQAKQSNAIVGSYSYNGLGQRIVKTLANGKGREFLYGQNGELLVETDQGGTVLTEYIYLDGTLLAIYQPDDNANGQTNAQEDAAGTNPISADYDGDGLSNNTEWFVTGTDARNPDTDGDGSSDSVEVAKGTDPLNNKSYPGDGDLNQDGLVDAGDLLLESQIVLGLRVPTATQLTHGDLNQDGVITLPDLLKLQRKALGLIALNALRTIPGYEQMLAMLDTANQQIQTATQTIESATHQLLASILTNANATPPTGKLYYVHTDQLGTPQALTDETGSVVWRATYDPFGKATVIVASIEMNIRMPGQYFDAETGLHYNYFRYYDPGTGRYTQSDPLGLIKESSDPLFAAYSKQLDLMSGINQLYAYINNNPLSGIDPLGLADFLNQCTGRYSICARTQDPSGSTLGNYLLIKGCKASVDTTCSKTFPACCDIESQECYAHAAGNDKATQACTKEHMQCVLKGK
ncbi:MAG: RHS repeat-associated core domain-containing protein [Gammaproteobacteria bacterium]